MKKIIITGANGQDGNILSRMLTKKGYLIFKFVRKKIKSNKSNYFITSNKKFFKIEKKINKIKPNTIIHFGSDNPSYNNKFTYKNYKKNLFFEKKLINYVIKNNKIKLILISSSKIFENKNKKVTENSTVFEQDYYSKFRIQSLKYSILQKKKFNLNLTVLILFNHDSKYRSARFLLPRLIKAIKKKQISFIKKIYSENISGDFSHAEDICNGIYLLIKKKINPDKLILSSGKRFYINNIIRLFLKKKDYMKFSVKIKKNKNLIGSNKLAKKILGWEPRKNIINAANEIYKYC
jgi:GDP-D-mannose dehydratase